MNQYYLDKPPHAYQIPYCPVWYAEHPDTSALCMVVKKDLTVRGLEVPEGPDFGDKAEFRIMSQEVYKGLVQPWTDKGIIYPINALYNQ
jgi:hypothetical protein